MAMVALFGVLAAGLAAIAVAAFGAGQYPDRDRCRSARRVDGDARRGHVPRPQKSSLSGGESGTVTPTDVEWFLDGERARGASPATLRSYGADLAHLRRVARGPRADRPRRRHARRPARLRVASLGARGLAPRPAPGPWLGACARCTAACDTAGRADHRPGRRPARARSASAGCPTRRASPSRPPARRPLGRRAARPARPRAAGAALRLRAARRRGLRRSTAATSTREVRVHGKGDSVRLVPIGGPASEAVAAWLAHGRPGAGRRPTAAMRCCCRAAAAASSRRPCAGARPPPRFVGLPPLTRTPSDTPTPPTCWSTAATCARSRSFSGMLR